MAVVYSTATTVDGHIADDQNSLDWLFQVSDEGTDESAWEAFLDSVGTLVMGRTTYEWVLDHERLLEQPTRWQEFYGDRPTWVFSHRDLPPLPGIDLRFVRGSVAEHHAAVTESAGGRDVWVVGGGDLAAQYADAGLLDRISLAVVPVFLGAGAPLLPRRLTSDRVSLRSVAPDGQRVRLEYEVSSPPP